MTDEQPEGTEYHVHLVQAVTATVDVYPTDGITSLDAAIDFAERNAPDPTLGNHGVDRAGDWEADAVYAADGVTEIWSASSPAAQAPQREALHAFTAVSATGFLTVEVRREDGTRLCEIDLPPDEAWRFVRGTSPARGEGKVYL